MPPTGRHDFAQDPIAPDTESGYPPVDFLTASPNGTFLDPFGLTNLLTSIPPTALELLKYEARMSIAALSTTVNTDESFDRVLMRDLSSPFCRFDAFAE